MKRFILAILCGAVASCSSEPKQQAQAALPPSTSQHVPIGQLPSIDIDALLAHTRKLSSDEFEGRAPGTKGEELSVNYIADQFQRAGLKPGNTYRSFVQAVPLFGSTPDPAPLTFKKGA